MPLYLSVSNTVFLLPNYLSDEQFVYTVDVFVLRRAIFLSTNKAHLIHPSKYEMVDLQYEQCQFT